MKSPRENHAPLIGPATWVALAVALSFCTAVQASATDLAGTWREQATHLDATSREAVAQLTQRLQRWQKAARGLLEGQVGRGGSLAKDSGGCPADMGLTSYFTLTPEQNPGQSPGRLLLSDSPQRAHCLCLLSNASLLPQPPPML
jgi:hypothetical protein